MSKIKAGDIVKRINSCTISSSMPIGTISVVDSLDMGGWLSFKGDNNSYSWENYELVKAEYLNKPHKHAELIKAWADGANIECLQSYNGRWHIIDAPMWGIHNEYRIKPDAAVKSDKDIQIEALEKQAKQLAADIAKLKS
jgi:hypothetical protein